METLCFLHVIAYPLQIVMVLLFLFQFKCFLFLFLFWMLGLPILCLKSDGSGHSWLFLDFRGRFFLNYFSMLNVMLAIDFSQSLYYFEICSLYNSFDASFYSDWMLNVFCHFFFFFGASTEMIFILPFVNVVYHIHWFPDSEPSLYPLNKFRLILLHDPFYILLNLVCYILLSIFTSIFVQDIGL